MGEQYGLHVKAGSRQIAKVWLDDAPVPDYNAEQQANARLIAAAPELLALGYRTVEALENIDGQIDLNKLVRDWLAAIVKATQEEDV